MVCPTCLIIASKRTEQRSPDTHGSPVNTIRRSHATVQITTVNTQRVPSPPLHVSSVPRSQLSELPSYSQNEGQLLPQYMGTRSSSAGAGTRRALASSECQHHLEAQLKQAKVQLCCPTYCPRWARNTSLWFILVTSQEGNRALPGPQKFRYCRLNRQKQEHSILHRSCSALRRQSAFSRPRARGEGGHDVSDDASLPQLTFADSEVRSANGLLHDIWRDRAHFPSQQLPLLPRQLFH